MSMVMIRAPHILIVIFVLFVSSLAARADWVNLSGAQSAPNIAEIHVNEDHIRLILEIFVKDMEKFMDLLPDDFFKQAGVDPPPLQERLRRFSNETFQFLIDEEKHLQAELKLVEPRMRKDRPNPFAGMINPYTRQLIPGPPKDKRVLYAELIYPFTGHPEDLIIIPPIGKQGISTASIGFIAYHKRAPIVDYRYLTQSSKLLLDWEDPWYSRFENKALKRWQQSGVRTFLYIEPYEVRHETMVRVKDMEAWMDLGLRGSEFIEVDEFEPMKKKIGEFLLKHSKVLIDGNPYRPILDRTSFVKYTMTRTFFIDQPERMPLSTAMLGVIITYITKGIPQEVTVDWDLFSKRIQKVPTSAVDPAGPFPSYVTPEDNVLVWKNFLKTYQIPTVAKLEVDNSLTHLKLPAASILCVVILLPVGFFGMKRRRQSQSIRYYIGLFGLLCVGSVLLFPYLNVSVARPSVMTPELSSKQAVTILDSLLKNIYRSFDFREEDAVYDRLATSVSGDLLANIYLQNRKSLVVTQAGGARARVKEVKILDVETDHLDDKPLGLLFHAKWTAMGTVGHWGHIHTRENQYEANIIVEPVEGAWKITGLELLEEKRIDPYALQKK
jgi:hypothetical protein